MAFYLVSAVPKHGRLEELGERLARAEFMSLRPFGATLSASLKEARIRKDGMAVWESGRALFFAGGNLFKHAPWIGRALADAALGEGVSDVLRPGAQLGRASAARGTGAPG